MNIAILGINIYDLLTKYFPTIKYKYYQCQKEMVISKDNPIMKQFSNSEYEKVNQFKTFKRQLEWIGGRLAIKRLTEIFSENGRSNSQEIRYKKSGAPFLKEHSDWNISISHSGCFAFGAISFDRSLKIGIDIEEIKSIDEYCYDALLKVGFSPRERFFLKSESIETLYKNWTVKESFLKYINAGFNENLMSVEIIDNTIHYNNSMENNIIINSQKIANYIFSYVYTKMKKKVKIHFYKPENVERIIFVS